MLLFSLKRFRNFFIFFIYYLLKFSVIKQKRNLYFETNRSSFSFLFIFFFVFLIILYFNSKLSFLLYYKNMLLQFLKLYNNFIIIMCVFYIHLQLSRYKWVYQKVFVLLSLFYFIQVEPLFLIKHFKEENENFDRFIAVWAIFF